MMHGVSLFNVDQFQLAVAVSTIKLCSVIETPSKEALLSENPSQGHCWTYSRNNFLRLNPTLPMETGLSIKYFTWWDYLVHSNFNFQRSRLVWILYALPVTTMGSIFQSAEYADSSSSGHDWGPKWKHAFPELRMKWRWAFTIFYKLTEICLPENIKF